ncbi:hypothetical protein Tco_0199838 [Tanacetum coccineum]
MLEEKIKSKEVFTINDKDAISLCLVAILELVLLGQEPRHNVPDWCLSSLRNANVKRWPVFYATLVVKDDDKPKYMLLDFTCAFKGARPSPRLTPDAFEASSDWWVSSRAFFNGRIREPSRILSPELKEKNAAHEEMYNKMKKSLWRYESIKNDYDTNVMYDIAKVVGKLQNYVSHHPIDLSTVLIPNDGSLEESFACIVSEETKIKQQESLRYLHQMQKQHKRFDYYEFLGKLGFIDKTKPTTPYTHTIFNFVVHNNGQLVINATRIPMYVNGGTMNITIPRMKLEEMKQYLFNIIGTKIHALYYKVSHSGFSIIVKLRNKYDIHVMFDIAAAQSKLEIYIDHLGVNFIIAKCICPNASLAKMMNHVITDYTSDSKYERKEVTQNGYTFDQMVEWAEQEHFENEETKELQHDSTTAVVFACEIENFIYDQSREDLLSNLFYRDLLKKALSKGIAQLPLPQSEHEAIHNFSKIRLIIISGLGVDLKRIRKTIMEKVNMPLLPSPKPMVSYFDDLDYFNDFEKEFPATVYNDAQTSKSDLLTEPILNHQHIDVFNLKDETSLSECDEKEQNVLYFNDLFPFNIIYPDDSKLDKDNGNDKIDIKHS